MQQPPEKELMEELKESREIIEKGLTAHAPTPAGLTANIMALP